MATYAKKIQVLNDKGTVMWERDIDDETESLVQLQKDVGAPVNPDAARRDAPDEIIEQLREWFDS